MQTATDLDALYEQGSLLDAVTDEGARLRLNEIFDAKVKELIPDDAHLHRWLDMARERIEFQGLPARICWVGLGLRAKLGLAFNEMVRSGEVSAPIVIGRDHLDSGSVASPNR